jgi:hypothetical protein
VAENVRSRGSDRLGIEPCSSCDSSKHRRGGQRDSHAPGCLEFRTPVTVSGLDLLGSSFLSNSHTEFITPSGCSILLNQALVADDEIDIRIGHREVRGRVAGKLRTLTEGHIYAIEFDQPANFRWDVPFPETADPGPTLHLHCSACDLGGEVTLTGVDALVYEAVGAIMRACPRCCERTLWRQERGANRQQWSNGPLPDSSSGSVSGEPVSGLPLASHIERLRPKPRTKDDRKSRRIQLKGAKACLQTPVRGTDVAVVVDISKGGLRFVSSKNYERGDWLRVAVPYTEGGTNIFVPAEIVRIEKRAAGSMPGVYALKFRSQ